MGRLADIPLNRDEQFPVGPPHFQESGRACGGPLVGYGKLAPKQLLAKLVPPEKLQEKAPEGLVTAAMRRVLGT